MQSSAIIRLLVLTIMISCTMATAFNAVPASDKSLCDWVVNQGNLNEAKDV
jgi:hypothetical protein